MKLLQGQQLYISKHMHNQALAMPEPQPPQPKPDKYLYPCLSTMIYQGSPIDWNAMGLVYTGHTYTWISADKIGLGAFVFHLPAPTFPESHLALYGIRAELGQPHIVTTSEQLAALRWIQIYPNMAFGCGQYSPYKGWSTTIITPGDPYVQISGMQYGAARTHPPGAYMMTGTWTFDPDCDDWWELGAYYCPVDTWMNWQFQYFRDGWTRSASWRISRNTLGQYTVLPPGVW